MWCSFCLSHLAWTAHGRPPRTGCSPAPPSSSTRGLAAAHLSSSRLGKCSCPPESDIALKGREHQRKQHQTQYSTMFAEDANSLPQSRFGVQLDRIPNLLHGRVSPRPGHVVAGAREDGVVERGVLVQGRRVQRGGKLVREGRLARAGPASASCQLRAGELGGVSIWLQLGVFFHLQMLTFNTSIHCSHGFRNP